MPHLCCDHPRMMYPASSVAQLALPGLPRKLLGWHIESSARFPSPKGTVSCYLWQLAMCLTCCCLMVGATVLLSSEDDVSCVIGCTTGVASCCCPGCPASCPAGAAAELAGPWADHVAGV